MAVSLALALCLWAGPPEPALPTRPLSETGWNLRTAGIVLTAAGSWGTTFITWDMAWGALGVGSDDGPLPVLRTVYLFTFPAMAVTGVALAIAGHATMKKAKHARAPVQFQLAGSGLQLRFR
jgi:hypothetical protein